MLDLDVVNNKKGKGYESVRDAVKRIGRQGYSAGQVLQQVCSRFLVDTTSTRLNVRGIVARCNHAKRDDSFYTKEFGCYSDGGCGLCFMCRSGRGVTVISMLLGDTGGFKEGDMTTAGRDYDTYSTVAGG